MSEISVLLVGSGAVRAHPTRAATCQIVSVNGRNLLIDCGRGAVHNMSRFGVPVETIDEVYLSHLHFDHVSDLPMLLLLSWNNGRSHTMPVYGAVGTEHFLEHGLRQAYKDDIQSRVTKGGKDPAKLEWAVQEIRSEGVLRAEPGLTISTLRTKHGGLDNHNFRFDTPGARVVITSDTEPDPRLIGFAKGADLLIVECSGTKEFYQTQAWGGWHMTPEDVGALAREAGVKTVVLKHLVVESFSDDPQVSEKMAETVRGLFDGEVLVGEDGMRFRYGGQP